MSILFTFSLQCNPSSKFWEALFKCIHLAAAVAWIALVWDGITWDSLEMEKKIRELMERIKLYPRVLWKQSRESETTWLILYFKWLFKYTCWMSPERISVLKFLVFNFDKITFVLTELVLSWMKLMVGSDTAHLDKGKEKLQYFYLNGNSLNVKRFLRSIEMIDYFFWI